MAEPTKTPDITVNVNSQEPAAPAPAQRPLSSAAVRALPKSSRKFSKWMLIINVALSWAAIYLGIWMGSTEGVIVSAFSLIGILFSAYMGVGHFDYRRYMNILKDVSNGDGTTLGDENDS